MGELSMTPAERERFLAEVRVGVLAVERPGRAPLASPVWYRYEPGGVVELNTESTTLKARLMEAAGRASLCVQRDSSPYAYVTVEGPVSFRPATRDVTVDLAVRYLGDEAGNAYVEQLVGDDVTVALTPERWYSADYRSIASV